MNRPPALSIVKPVRGTFAILLATLAATQDPLDDPLKALESGDPKRALAAADALVDWKGDDAALKARLDALPDGAKFYARMILAERDALKARPDHHKPPKRVDVAFSALSLDAAIEKCSEAIGYPVRKEDWGGDEDANKEITLDLKQATPLEVISTLARESGYDLYSRGDAYVLQRDWGGGAPPAPPAFWRNYMVRVDQIEIERSTDFQNGPQRLLQLNASLYFDAHVADACSWKSKTTLLEAVDDKGVSLVRPEPAETPAAPGFSDPPKPDAPVRHLSSCSEGLVSLNFDLRPLSDGATKIARFRAAVDVSVPKSLADLKVDPFKPGDYECGPYKVTVENLARKRWEWSLRVRVRRVDGKDLDTDSLHVHVEATPGEAQTYNNYVNGRLSKPDEAVYEMNFYESGGFVVEGEDAEPNPALLKSVRVKAVESTTFRVYVELSDVPVSP